MLEAPYDLPDADADVPGSAVEAESGRYVAVAGACALALLGLAGNYFSLPLFFGIDLIFGSIATFVGIRLCGSKLGVLVAIPGALYTIVLWGQPYSAIVLLCEATFVAMLVTRLRYLAVADTLFWLFLGGPLLALSFLIFFGQPFPVTALVVLKQFVNSILSASVASIIVMGVTVLKKRRNVSFSELLFNILVLAILVPGMAHVSIDTRLTRFDLENAIADKLKTSAAFANLALRHTQAASVPLVQGMAFQASLNRLPLVKDVGIRYLALDGRTLAETGNADLPSSGTTLRMDTEIEIWLPERADAPILDWWRRAKYVLRRDMSDLLPGSVLVMTYDARPLILRLEARNLSSLMALGALTILTILLALLTTQFLSRPLQKLGLASARLVDDIEKKNVTPIPDGWIHETNSLAIKFREMASALMRSYTLIDDEKKLSDDLLRNILPHDIAEELKKTGTTVARHFDQVTVIFTDFKGFTQLAEKLSPSELVAEIHSCFTEFDAIVTRNNLEKIKTIGDAYMCAGGVPVANQSHAHDAVMAALQIRDFMEEHRQARTASGHESFEIRIGIHTGPVIAGVVGEKKFAYDIWGDTVNTASRIESSGQAGLVNISAATYALVRDDFNCVNRGQIAAKGKGEIDMYFVERLSGASG